MLKLNKYCGSCTVNSIKNNVSIKSDYVTLIILNSLFNTVTDNQIKIKILILIYRKLI